MFSEDDKALAGASAEEADDEVPPPPPPEEPPTKKQKTADGADEAAKRGEEDPSTSGEADQVAAALQKIVTHISNPRRFKKASPLLRQLLSQGAVTRAHAGLLFEALKGPMKDPSLAIDPTQTMEYQKLFTLASKHAELFSLRQRGQLDVYGLWGVLRGQLLTDDSFVFNRALTRIKTSVSHLAEATPEDDEALTRLKERLAKDAEEPAAQEPAAQAAPPAEDAEADPFGLEQIIQKQEAPRRERGGVWSSREALAMKREALLDCFDTARSRYDQAWARTSVDIAIQELHKAAGSFCASQQPRIAALRDFVQRQRLLRKQGPSAKEARRDTTTFEAARAEWSKATLSIKGSVGATGDHRSEVWLG